MSDGNGKQEKMRFVGLKRLFVFVGVVWMQSDVSGARDAC